MVCKVAILSVCLWQCSTFSTFYKWLYTEHKYRQLIWQIVWTYICSHQCRLFIDYLYSVVELRVYVLAIKVLFIRQILICLCKNSIRWNKPYYYLWFTRRHSVHNRAQRLTGNKCLTSCRWNLNSHSWYSWHCIIITTEQIIRYHISFKPKLTECVHWLILCSQSRILWYICYYLILVFYMFLCHNFRIYLYHEGFVWMLYLMLLVRHHLNSKHRHNIWCTLPFPLVEGHHHPGR